jgi:alpha-beta hydrolase superfamily lysophospholipase
LFLKLAPVLAQSGTAVLAIESRRSGWAGHETALLDFDAEDIDAWVRWLIERGYEKIVLAGASIGSISVGRYQSVRQHPNVVAIAHLMPTADCPDWFRAAAGEGPYMVAVQQARASVAAGRGGRDLIDIDVRQPPPSKTAGRFRWTQRADSWLSWWGPDADSRNIDHIANAGVPLLLLSGTDDSYNDEARFAELKAAAVNAPSVEEIWYRNIDHGLAGVETRVARDLHEWMARIKVL